MRSSGLEGMDSDHLQEASLRRQISMKCLISETSEGMVGDFEFFCRWETAASRFESPTKLSGIRLCGVHGPLTSATCGKCGLPARLETLRSGDGFKQATVVPQRRRCLKKVALFLFLFDLDSVGFDIPTTSPENAQNAYSSGQGAELEGTLDKVNDHLSSLTQDIL